MRLSHNLASLNVYKAYSKAVEARGTSMARISSGYKINSSKDDPTVIAQSEKLRMQIRGLQMAGKNAQDGVSMLQTAEGGLEGMTEMAQRIRQLVVQSGDGTMAPSDKESIQKEINQLIDGMDDIAKNTEFNGVRLLADKNVKVTDKNATIRHAVGANVDEIVNISTYNLTSDSIPINEKNSTKDTLDQLKSGEKYALTTNNLDKALIVVDNTLNDILQVRSKYGALENRFDATISNLDEIGEKMTGAESTIRDSDIAEEMAEVAKNNILVEAGNALMVQTNKMPQDILRVLENVRSR